MAAKGWQRCFEDPIEILGRKPLITLKDAADYILKLPKTEHEAPEWLAAMESSRRDQGSNGTVPRANGIRPDFSHHDD